jgi:hypothetical protein
MEHSQRGAVMRDRGAIWKLFVCAVFGVISSGAANAAPYFSLSTDKTFAPHEKVTIHMYTRDVHALEFRMYRVNDPVLFFEKLRDIHGFGAGRYEEKEQIDQKTWIERFHDWKDRTCRLSRWKKAPMWWKRPMDSSAPTRW